MRYVPRGKIFVYHINDAMDLPFSMLEPARHRLYPTDGVIDLRALNEALRKAGYDEMASLELFGPWLANTDAETVIREGAEKTRKIIGVQTLKKSKREGDYEILTQYRTYVSQYGLLRSR